MTEITPEYLEAAKQLMDSYQEHVDECHERIRAWTTNAMKMMAESEDKFIRVHQDDILNMLRELQELNLDLSNLKFAYADAIHKLQDSIKPSSFN